MNTTLLTVLVSSGTSVLTTLAMGAYRAWRYRPRPYDPELMERAMKGFTAAATSGSKPPGRPVE